MTAEVAAHRDVEARAAGEAVAAIYRAAVPAMRDLPVFNPALDVAAIGFRALDDHAFGVIVTPWFMNLVRLPLDPATAGRSQGEVVTRVFQGVHMMLEGDHQRAWKEGEPRESRVVFIGRDLPEQAIRDGFAKCIAS